MVVRAYDSHFRGPCRTERAEQIDCISWLGYHYPVEFALVFHCANETRGTQMHYAMRHKEGVKAGVPDIIHIGGTEIWRAGLFELKRMDRTKSRLSHEQKAFLEDGDARGCFSSVCYGFEQFKVAWLDYLSGLRS